jgi:hypothetical protein
MCAQDGVIEWVSPESLPAGKFDDVSCMKRRLLHADDAAFQAHADLHPFVDFVEQETPTRVIAYSYSSSRVPEHCSVSNNY